MLSLAMIVSEKGPNREPLDWMYGAAQLKHRPALELSAACRWIFQEIFDFFFNPHRLMAGGTYVISIHIIVDPFLNNT